MSYINLTLPVETPNFEESIKCFLELANSQGFWHHSRGRLSQEESVKNVKTIMENFKNGFDKMTTNERVTYLKKIKNIRHEISDEVWNARLPGNGSIPYDYHMVRRSKFFDIIRSIPLPNGGSPNVLSALDDLFMFEFQGSQMGIHDDTRKKVLKYIDCLISIIMQLYTDVRNNEGGNKKSYRKKTYRKIHKKPYRKKTYKKRKNLFNKRR